MLLSDVLWERIAPNRLIFVLSLHHSERTGCGGGTRASYWDNNSSVNWRRFGQNPLLVPGVSNGQSVSGSLEPTSKKTHQGWGGFWASVTPRLERACVPMCCLLCGSHVWGTLSGLSRHWPTILATSQLHCHLWSWCRPPFNQTQPGPAKLGTFSKQTMEGAGPYLWLLSWLQCCCTTAPQQYSRNCFSVHNIF